VDPLAAADVTLVRADNPGPFTLEGSNTWLVGRDPCWVVDPGLKNFFRLGSFQICHWVIGTVGALVPKSSSYFPPWAQKVPLGP